MRKTINTPNAPKAIGPYSQGVFSGNTLYISGQIPVNIETGMLVNKDISEQTIQVMENIYAILCSIDMNFSNIVKTSIYLTDLNNFEKVNEVYGSYFQENPPARECIQATRLPKNAEIEISVIAIKD